jgi:transposase
VFDRYHLMTHLIKAVDSVWKEEHRELKGEGDNVLTGTKYLWLYSRENLPAKHRRKFAVLRRKRLRTARAWALKESLRDFWGYQSPAGALTILRLGMPGPSGRG